MSGMADRPISPELRGLAALIGTWRGGGHGEYPTVADFDYEEEMRFWHHGDAYLQYQQRTWIAGTGLPSHNEAGFWRAHPGGGVDVTLAHPLGLVEVSEGTIAGNIVDLASTVVARTPVGAMAVVSIARRYDLDGDLLTYELQMQTDETPLAMHLRGTVRRER
jgi:hypothetical protein